VTEASDMPYWQTAQTYFEAGWSPIPLPYKEKSPVPDNVTGSTAPYVTAEQVARWVGRKTLGSKFRGRPEQAKAGNLSFMPGNIALRLPMNVLGIDIDLYGGKAGAETLADAEKRWGELPPTWLTTSRTDGSGIRLYRVPEGLKWRDVGPGIESIKWYHRYAIVMPSVHDKTGKRYAWVRPDGRRVTDEFPSVDELPMLPAKWVAGLTDGQAYAGSGDAGDIDYESAKDWLAQYGSGELCSTMHSTLAQYTRSVREAGEDGGAHDRARDGAWALLGDAGLGHTGAQDAIRQLGAVFLTAVAGRRDGSPEWRRAVIKGVGKVREELKRNGDPDGDPCNMFSDSKPASVASAKPGGGAGSSTFDYICDDIGNAQRLVRAVGTDARWVPAHKSWAVYDPATSLWRLADGEDAMTRAAMDMVRKMRNEAAFLEDPKQFLTWVKSSGGDARLNAMLKLARSFPNMSVDAAQFDADPRALHVENGVVVLGPKGATFRGRRHEDLATFCAPVEYRPVARSLVWDEFLDTVLPDLEARRWVQTLYGYSLLGANPERAFILAKGESTSGKSTMAEAIHKALGAYAKTYDSQLFRAKLDEGPRADILDALPKRFLYCLEGSASVPWHADVIKRATGNDRIRARGMHSNVYVERTPAFTPWLVSNAYPNIPGSDKALKRRIFAAPFTSVVLEVDTGMGEKLAAPAVLEAIMAWLVEGWDLYARDGLTKPSLASLGARQDAINAMSLFDSWLSECCEEGPERDGYVTPAESLRESWAMWLADNGHDEPKWCTRQWFGAKMADHGFETRYMRVGDRSNDVKVTHRVGVRLSK
jgi:putative DNA primase/helicase